MMLWSLCNFGLLVCHHEIWTFCFAIVWSVVGCFFVMPTPKPFFPQLEATLPGTDKVFHQNVQSCLAASPLGVFSLWSPHLLRWQDLQVLMFGVSLQSILCLWDSSERCVYITVSALLRGSTTKKRKRHVMALCWVGHFVVCVWHLFYSCASHGALLCQQDHSMELGWHGLWLLYVSVSGFVRCLGLLWECAVRILRLATMAV